MRETLPLKPALVTSREKLRAAIYAAILLWINLYIARNFFSGHTAYMASMHGFWIAMAERGAGAWFHPRWWPYWGCGIAFEAAYAPLVPALSSAWAALLHTAYDIAFSLITGIAYCLAPLSLFLMAWGLTRLAAPVFSPRFFTRSPRRGISRVDMGRSQSSRGACFLPRLDRAVGQCVQRCLAM